MTSDKTWRDDAFLFKTLARIVGSLAGIGGGVGLACVAYLAVTEDWRRTPADVWLILLAVVLAYFFSVVTCCAIWLRYSVLALRMTYIVLGGLVAAIVDYWIPGARTMELPFALVYAITMVASVIVTTVILDVLVTPRAFPRKRDSREQ